MEKNRAALCSRTARIAAVLHDLVEDTPYTFEELEKRGYSAAVVRALKAVTKQDGEDYAAFVMRAGQDPIGCTVKRADLEDNLQATRLQEMSEEDALRMKKYHAARQTLKQINRGGE